MRTDQDWEDLQAYKARISSAGMGALRITLLFGSAAIALGLIVAPLVQNQLSGSRVVFRDSSGLDYTSTGSIGAPGSYTLRRSVLQSSPTAVCVIRENGVQTGDCP